MSILVIIGPGGGVVEDARRNQLREPPAFQLYLPLAQAPDLTASALFVRTSGDPERPTALVATLPVARRTARLDAAVVLRTD